MESSAHVRPCPAEGLDRRLLVDPEVRLLVDPSVVRLMLGHLHQRRGVAMVLEVVLEGGGANGGPCGIGPVGIVGCVEAICPTSGEPGTPKAPVLLTIGAFIGIPPI